MEFSDTAIAIITMVVVSIQNSCINTNLSV